MKRREILVFCLTFLPVFALLAVAYEQIGGVHHKAIVAMVNPVVGSLDPPLSVSVQPGGSWAITDLELGHQVFEVDSSGVKILLWNSVLLAALLLATPVGVGRRLVILMQGLLLFLPLQVVQVVVWLRIRWPRGSSGYLVELVDSVCNAGGWILAPAIWVALAARWWAQPTAGAPSETRRS